MKITDGISLHEEISIALGMEKRVSTLFLTRTVFFGLAYCWEEGFIYVAYKERGAMSVVARKSWLQRGWTVS